MHDLFIDEAGTSGAPHEPVSVVAGVVVPFEKRSLAIEVIQTMIAQMVPPQFRENFVFHALELMHNDDFRVGWPLLGPTGRLALLHSMMRIPMVMQLPIIWAAGQNAPTVAPEFLVHVSKAEFIHIVTFLSCIGTFNQYLTGANETGMVIVENVIPVQTRLNYAFHMMKTKPFTMAVDYSDTRHVPELSPTTLEFNNARIKDNPYFLPKDASPLMYLADACAFGVRSFLSGAKHSDDYGRIIFGEPQMLRVRKHIATVSGGITEWAIIGSSSDRTVAE